MEKLTVKMFPATDKYPGHAVWDVTKRVNEYLETVPAEQVVSIQFQQSCYRDMDGDYPQDMFWYTALVTVRESDGEQEATETTELVDYDPDDPFLSAPDDTYTIDTSEHPISCPCWKCEERRAAK